MVGESIWRYNTMHDCICQVIETQILWGETTGRVWLPGSNSVVRIPAAKLRPIANVGNGTSHETRRRCGRLSRSGLADRR